jgi:hypothetical protein
MAYKPKAFFWESVIALEKVAVAAVAVLLGRRDLFIANTAGLSGIGGTSSLTDQTFVCLMVMLVLLGMTMGLNPYGKAGRRPSKRILQQLEGGGVELVESAELEGGSDRGLHSQERCESISQGELAPQLVALRTLASSGTMPYPGGDSVQVDEIPTREPKHELTWCELHLPCCVQVGSFLERFTNNANYWAHLALILPFISLCVGNLALQARRAVNPS